ncbi:MAG: GGDEF domain-containing protein [Planctomycetaceae bacterium]
MRLLNLLNRLEQLPQHVVFALCLLVTVLLILVGSLAARLRYVIRRAGLLSRSDDLTGAANSKALRERLEVEINRCSRSGRPLTLAYIDCDRFKQINDTLGHAAGDQVLKSIVIAMQANTRSYDVVARVGGDEFVMLLPETDEKAARAAIDRIQHAVSRDVSAGDQPVSVSIGVFTDLHPTNSPDEMLRAADRLMYAAKRKGTGLAEYEVRSVENAGFEG